MDPEVLCRHDALRLFRDIEVSGSEDNITHLNQYPVLSPAEPIPEEAGRDLLATAPEPGEMQDIPDALRWPIWITGRKTVVIINGQEHVDSTLTAALLSAL
ncbi:MAG: hypothetical protein IJ083_18100 [Clostridia bacterium]|nr:hypothetical protein [Clostridia bacterium]